MQREEMAMNRRELGRSAEAQIRSERSFAMQTRLAVYQNLVEHHRYWQEQAGGDALLRHRSTGRTRAYIQLQEETLRALDAYAAGIPETVSDRRSYDEHSTRIDILYREYHEQRDTASNPDEVFQPVGDTLCQLVEEIAFLTELNRERNTAGYYLLNAGHCVNAATRPQDLLSPEESSVDVRRFQLQQADSAFAFAQAALAALNHPDLFLLDPAVGVPSTELLIAMYRRFREPPPQNPADA